MDVERAAAMYAAGVSLDDVALDQGVARSTVVLNLKKAGVEIRKASGRARSASTDEIVGLHESGVSSTEIAVRLGVSYDRVRSAIRAAQKVAERQRSGRWHQVLLDALDEQRAIVVTTAVEAYLGGQPTRSEITAARRAAARLATTGKANLHRVRLPNRQGQWLVLSRSSIAELTDLDLRRLAENPKDNGRVAYDAEMQRRNRAESLQTLRRNMTLMAKTLAALDARALSADDVADLAQRAERLANELTAARARLRWRKLG